MPTPDEGTRFKALQIHSVETARANQLAAMSPEELNDWAINPTGETKMKPLEALREITNCEFNHRTDGMVSFCQECNNIANDTIDEAKAMEAKAPHPSPAERAVGGGYELWPGCEGCTLAETDAGDHWQWRHIPLSRGYLTIEKEAVGQFVPELLAKLLREFMAWNHLGDAHPGGPDPSRPVCALISMMTAGNLIAPSFNFYFVDPIDSITAVEHDLGGEA